MKLYHGTTIKKLTRIMKIGLEPRRSRTGNWKHNNAPSRTDCVYMTNAYAIFFALNASNVASEDPCVLEIDTLKLKLSCLLPDEDFLEQATRGMGDAPLDWPMLKRTAWYRARLEQFSSFWEKSLKHLGNCSYKGTIPVEAITRIAVIDQTDQAEFCWQALDPSITLMNYHIVGTKYRGMTKWLFGDDMGEDAPKWNGMFYSWEVPKHRKGIEVIDTSTCEPSHPLLRRAARLK